jgi:O-antigen ligase
LVPFAFLRYIIDFTIIKNIGFSKAPLSKPILMFLLVCALSLMKSIKIFPQDIFIRSFIEFYRFCSFALIFFLVVNLVKSLDQAKKIIFFIVFCGIVQTMVGLIESVAFYGGFQNQVFNIYELIGYNPRNIYYHYYRAGGLQGTPENLGFIIASFAPILLFLSVTVRNRLSKMGLGLSLVIMFVTIIITGTRMAMVMIGILLGIYMMYSPRKIRSLKYCFLAVLVFAGGCYFSDVLITRWTELFLSRESTSLFWKSQVWESALKLFPKEPILGSGWATFKYQAIEHYRELIHFEYSSGRFASRIDNAQNMYLQILVDCGMAGLCVFLWMWFRVISSTWKAIKITQDIFWKNFALAMFSSFIAFAFAGLFNSLHIVRGNTYTLISLFWLYCGLVSVLWREIQNSIGLRGDELRSNKKG